MLTDQQQVASRHLFYDNSNTIPCADLTSEERYGRMSGRGSDRCFDGARVGCRETLHVR
jgi:hypothetical protein